MRIDCDTCTVRGRGCHDCVVAVLLGPPGEDDRPGRRPEVTAGAEADTPVELDPADRAALTVLAECGLVPPLRWAAGDDTISHSA